MIRWCILLFWTGLVFIFTCTTSLEDLLQQGIITFKWTSQPNFSEFLYPLPTGFDEAFITRKMGHAVSFFILTLLVYYRFLSVKMMIAMSLLYASITEILQLFFQRGGRLFDIGIDGIGIVVAFIFVAIVLSMNNEKSLTRKRSQT